jgi:hypothetical protein
MKTLFTAIALALAPLLTKALPLRRTFNQPQVDGYRLDWCRQWTVNCGAPAAAAFCRAKGFSQASTFQQDIDVRETTKVIGDGRLCTSSWCDSFQYIECLRSRSLRNPPNGYYAKPRYEGYRLDWCKYFASECGSPAADEFCKAQGFGHAGSFAIEGDVGEYTKVIGDYEELYLEDDSHICTQSYCDGFEYIDCEY